MKIKGIVIHGKNKGKGLGFPTANIKFSGELENGVYEGIVTVGGKEHKAGVFREKLENLLEANILGFSGDLYGKEIEVEIIKKIRDIKKFENDEELKRQIAEDIKLIKNSLHVHGDY